MRDLPPLLFNKFTLSEAFHGQLQRVTQVVNDVPENQFIHSSNDQIVEHVFSILKIIPLKIYEDLKEMNTQEVQIDVRSDLDRSVFDRTQPCLIPGLKISVSIPFSGEFNQWQYRPSTCTSCPPRAHIKSQGEVSAGGTIEIMIFEPSDTLDDGSRLKQEIEKTLSEIKWYLENSRKEIDEFNKKLHSEIKKQVAERRQRLDKHTKIIKTLNIPLRRDPNAPNLSVLPIKRKLIRPLPANDNTPLEPGIRDEDYNHILKVIRHEGCSFESTPITFKGLGEEDLRNIILAHLNGHYEGLATGETFRGKGKTDIRIEDQNRAAFVAECKIWHGEEKLLESIDQLLGYLTWRDCKGAMVIFNKHNSGFSRIQAQIPSIFKDLSKTICAMEIKENGEWRFKVRSLNDEDLSITLHIFLFNLYVA